MGPAREPPVLLCIAGRICNSMPVSGDVDALTSPYMSLCFMTAEPSLAGSMRESMHAIGQLPISRPAAWISEGFCSQ